MGPICIYSNETELQPFKDVLKDYIAHNKDIKQHLKDRYLEKVENMTLQDMNTIMSHLRTKGYTIVTFIDPSKNPVFETYSSAKQSTLMANYTNDIKKFRNTIQKLVMPFVRSNSAISDLQQTAKPVTSIGNAQIILYGKEARELPHKKNAPLYNPTTLYIYEEDLQAADESINKQGLSYEQLDPKLNVGSTSAKLRTDEDGNRNPNALGLIVKRNGEMSKANNGERGYVDAKSSMRFIKEASLKSEEADKYQKVLADFIAKIKSLTTPSTTYKWSTNPSEGYEITTRQEDGFGSKFSAKNATLRTEYVTLNIGGKTVSVKTTDENGKPLTIEQLYQGPQLKNSRKGAKPNKKSALYFEGVKEEAENFSYYNAYLPLWMQWAKENPELIEELRTKISQHGNVLVDRFAENTTVNQARALSDILAGTVYGNVWFPNEIALDKSGLPQALCMELQGALAELGIATEMEESALTKGKEELQPEDRLYGLRTTNIKVNERTVNRSEKYKKLQEEATESLEAEAPEISELKLGDVNPLVAAYPDIYKRKSRVTTMTQMFMSLFDALSNQIVELYSNSSNLSIDNGDAQIKRLIESGDLTEKFKGALMYKQKDEAETPFIQLVINQLNDIINAYAKEEYVDGSAIDGEVIDAFIEDFYTNPVFDNYITNEYKIELEEAKRIGKTIDSKTLRNRARNYIQFFSQLQYKQGLKEAMLREVFAEVEDWRNIQLSLERKEAEDSAIDTANYEDENEGDADTRSEQLFIQWKVKDPIDTATIRVKNALKETYQTTVKNGNLVYERNDLGTRIANQYQPIYYKCQEVYAKMNSSKDFWRKTKQLAQKYPWFRDLAVKLQDFDFACEFYGCMRNTANIYGNISPNGRLVLKNSTYTLGIFMDNVRKMYEGHVLLSEQSVYKADGTVDNENLNKLRQLFNIANTKISDLSRAVRKNKAKRDEAYLQYAPLSVAEKSLKPGSNAGVAKYIQAYRLLTDKSSIHNLDNVLRAIGVETDYFDMTKLLPIIDETVLSEIDSVEKLNRVWTVKQREQVYKVLSEAQAILASYGTREQNLVEGHKGYYNNMAKQMISIAEGYTSAQFWDGENNRNTYTKPNKIDVVIDTISTVDEQEDVDNDTEYIKKEYMDVAFLQDMPLIQELYESTNPNNPAEHISLRKKIRKYDMLNSSVSGRKKEIGRFEPLDYLMNAMSMYELEMDSQDEVAYYLNPLESDAPVMQIFRLPRTIGPDFKEQILGKLYKVAVAETKRILAHQNFEELEKRFNVLSKKSDLTERERAEMEGLRRVLASEIKVANFNEGKKRALQFCMLPMLNKYREQITRAFRSTLDNYDFLVQEGNEYFRNLLIGENGFLRVEMERELEKFKGKYTDEEKLSVLELLKKANSYSSKVANDDELDAKEAEAEAQNIEDADESLENAPEEEETEKEEKTHEELEMDLADINERMDRFFYDDFYMQSQLNALLMGDPAFAKNQDDWVKRAKQQIYSAGRRVYALDEQGNPVYERVGYLRDRSEVVNAFPTIQKLLKGHINPSLANQVTMFFKGYLNNNSTDGQGLRTPKAMKQLFKQMGGILTPKLNKAFDDLANGKVTDDVLNTVINSLKPLVSTWEKREIAGRDEKVLVQHKNSEFMLTALYTALNTAFNHSPEYRALQHFMEVHNLDAVQFESVVKLGLFNPINLNYSQRAFDNNREDAISLINERIKKANIKSLKSFGDTATYEDIDSAYRKLLEQELIDYDTYRSEFVDKYTFIDEGNEEKAIADEKALRDKLLEMSDEALDKYIEQHPRSALASLERQMRQIGEENYVHTISYEDIMLMQPSDDHLTDSEALKGSQMRNIAPADMPNYGDGVEGRRYSIHVGGVSSKYTWREMQSYYDALITYPTVENFLGLFKTFMDDPSLKEMLYDMAKKNPKYGKEVLQALLLESDEHTFEMPFDSPILHNKFSDLFLSSFKNNIQRQKIKGGNIPLVTSYSTDLRIETDDKGTPIAMQCYLPAFSKDFVQDYGELQKDGTYTINFENLAKNEELMKIIGYRIPTEQKYSMFALKIVGFTPQSSMSIILPAAAVTMSGFDFDIDKLFLMIKEYERSKRPASMANDFLEWAAKNDRYHEITDELYGHMVYKDAETGEQSERTRAFSPKEIDKLRQNDLFKDFYDTLPKSDIQYRIYKPKLIMDDEGRVDLLETVKLKDVKDKDVRRKIRNNMFIDLIWDILTSPEGAALSYQPAHYADVSLGAAIDMIFDHNPQVLEQFYKDYNQQIKKYGIYDFMTHFAYYTTGDKTLDNPVDNSKALEKYYEGNAEEAELCSFAWRSDKFFDLMQGNALISIMAANSSRHYKFQFLDDTTARINPAYTFTLIMPDGKEVKFNRFNPLYSPVDGVLNSYYLSQDQAASPDNGKDPKLGKQRVSIETSGQTTYMDAIGIPLPLRGILNNAELDILPKARQILGTYEAEEKQKLIENSDVLDLRLIPDIMMKMRLNMAISKTEQDAIASYALWWQNCILDASSAYKVSSTFVRADSPNGAISTRTAEALMNLLKTAQGRAKMNDMNFPFPGMKNIIDFDFDPSILSEEKDAVEQIINKINQSKLPRLQAYWSCGIKGASGLVQRHLSEYSMPFINTLAKLANMTSYLRESDIGTFVNELTTYMMSSAEFARLNTLNTTDYMATRNFYVHDFPMHYKAFVEGKNDEGEYLHPEVRNLTIIKMLSATEDGIKFRNLGGKMSKDAKSIYAEGLGAMFRSPDAEVRKFAGHLMRYAFFEHGFNFGHSNFGTLYPTEIAVAADGYRESLHKGNERILSNDTNFLNTYLEEFLLNHHRLIAFFKKGLFNVTTSGNTVLINAEDDKVDNLLVMYDTLDNDKLVYRPLIRMPVDRNSHTETYVLHFLRKDNQNRLVYEIVDYNKTDIPFYDNGDGETYSGTSPYEIKWKEVKPRGRVIGLDKLKSEESNASPKKAEPKTQEMPTNTSKTTEDNDPVSKMEGITINIGQGGTLNLFTSQTMDTRKTTEPADSGRAEPNEPTDTGERKVLEPKDNDRSLNEPMERREPKTLVEPREESIEEPENLSEIKEVEDPTKKACY